MSETTVNGRATLRDVMELQSKMNQQQQEIRKEMNDGFLVLKTQNAKNSAIVAMIVSALMSILVGVTITLLTGAIK